MIIEGNFDEHVKDFRLVTALPTADDLGDTYDSFNRREEEGQRLSQAEYDGFRGSLPEWIPTPLQEEFIAVRKYFLRLLGEYPQESYKPQEILDYMKARKAFLKDAVAATESGVAKLEGNHSCPAELFDKVDALNYIQDLERLGKEKGLKEYLGKGPFKILRGIAMAISGSKGGKKYGKNRKPPYHKLLEALAAPDLNTLLGIFKEGAYNLEQFIEAGTIWELNNQKKVNLRVKEIDWEEKRVYFVDKDANRCDASFKTLRTNISKYRIK